MARRRPDAVQVGAREQPIRHARHGSDLSAPRVQPVPGRQARETTRALTKEDFSQKGSIFLRPEAQFDYFITKAGDPQLPQIIISATESIGADYQNLKGVLPKQEYQSIPAELLGDLVRTLNPPQACIAASSCTSDSNG